MQKELVIEPVKGLSALRLKEIWEYRELFYFLIWRDIKLRYKQTLLGFSWAIFRPLISMVAFTFVFNKIAGFTSNNVPYLLFTFVGIMAWNFFSEGVISASQSLLLNTNLISKVYIPRLIIPSATILKGLVDFLVAFAIYLCLTIHFSYLPGWQIVLLPFAIFWVVLTSLGFGLWLSAIGLKYRDISQALPFIIQILFWVTPVGYSSSNVPAGYQLFYWLNPMTGVVETFRYVLLGVAHLPFHLFIISFVVSVIIFITGLINFRHMEKEFADVI